MPTVIFLHGLNTFGDDLIHVGPLTFGPMHSHLEVALAANGVNLVPILELGFGSPEEQASKALDYLHHQLEPSGVVDSSSPLHLLGHSVGGIVARCLARRADLKDRIKTVMTLGTPHHGASAAEFGLSFSSRYPTVHRLACLLGYDASKRSAAFRHFTSEAMKEFNENYPEQCHEFALVCEVSKEDVSLPLRALHRHLQPSQSAFLKSKANLPLSDGFISSSSQQHGHIIGPFALDHFAQLGVYFHPTRLALKKAAVEFQRLAVTIADLARKQESP